MIFCRLLSGIYGIYGKSITAVTEKYQFNKNDFNKSILQRYIVLNG